MEILTFLGPFMMLVSASEFVRLRSRTDSTLNFLNSLLLLSAGIVLMRSAHLWDFQLILSGIISSIGLWRLIRPWKQVQYQSSLLQLIMILLFLIALIITIKVYL
jgi:hypothetical protein